MPKGETDLFDDGRQHGKKTSTPSGDRFAGATRGTHQTISCKAGAAPQGGHVARNVKPPRERREAQITIEQIHRPRTRRGRNENPDSRRTGGEGGLTIFLIQPPKDMAAKCESCVTHAIPKEVEMADERHEGRFSRRPDNLYRDRCGLLGVASGIFMRESHGDVLPTGNAGTYMDSDTKNAFL